MRVHTAVVLAAAVSAAAAAAVSAATAAAVGCENANNFRRQYSPIVCASTEECACPRAGTPVCAKCPFDSGSSWKDDKVCFCKGLPSGSGIECSTCREFSPKKVSVSDDGKAGTGSEELEKEIARHRNVDEFNRQYLPIVCASTEECVCPRAGTPVCAKCPFDAGSLWKDDKVCLCKDLPTGSSGIECSTGRQFSPKKVKVAASGKALTAEESPRALTEATTVPPCF